MTTTNRVTYPAGALLRVGDICRGSTKPGKPDKPGLLPISRATWYRWIKAGRAPEGRKLGQATTVWPIEVVMAIGHDQS